MYITWYMHATCYMHTTNKIFHAIATFSHNIWSYYYGSYVASQPPFQPPQSFQRMYKKKMGWTRQQIVQNEKKHEIQNCSEMHFNGIYEIRESIVNSRFVGTVRTLYFPAVHITLCIQAYKSIQLCVLLQIFLEFLRYTLMNIKSMHKLLSTQTGHK